MAPPHDIPEGKKLIAEYAGRWLHRSGSMASNTTSFGIRTMRPVAPDRTKRDGALTSLTTSTRRLIAALRSALSTLSASNAYASARRRDVPSAILGSSTAANSAMMASTQTISSRVNPPSPQAALWRPARDVGGQARSAFLTVRSEGDKIIGTMLTR